MKENKIVFEKGIESDESVESERDFERDTRKTNKARIVIADDVKKEKKDKKAKKRHKKEKKKEKKERKRARRERKAALDVSPLEEMVQEENAEEKCLKCAMRAP